MLLPKRNMSRLQEYRVIDPNGARGTLLTTSRFLDDNPHRLIRLADGQELLVPKQLLKPNDDGSFLLTVPVSDLVHRRPEQDREPSREPQSTLQKQSPQSEKIVPVIQEELDVGRRTVESGRIRVNKRVETTESVIDEPLLHQSYDVQRTAVNRIVEDIPEPHYDGDTLVLPILEEVLVVEKRLILREEVRITPVREEVRDPQTHTVRREHIDVERVQ
jgi:uncharacterized protein (TIGR02271 family)